jgi:hypothetical protein
MRDSGTLGLRLLEGRGSWDATARCGTIRLSGAGCVLAGAADEVPGAAGWRFGSTDTTSSDVTSATAKVPVAPDRALPHRAR